MDKARKAVLSALNSVFEEDSYSNIILDNIFKSSDLTPLDKKFASALFYGVLDRKITLDYVLSKFVKKDFSKTPVITLNALRMALYQIMYMDKVPDSAAVNESVNLVKASKQKYTASFVNGVLRNILRNGIELPKDDGIYSLSVNYSCPEHIVKEFIADYGKETATEILKATLMTPSVYIKTNTLKISAVDLCERLKEDGITAQTVNETAVKIIGSIDVTASKCYKEGLFHTEDLACQKAVEILSPESGERILDMCSAPGGKAFTMAETMQNKGEIVACDIYESRTALIASGAKRLGIEIIKPTVQNSENSLDLGTFDAVLCDVPCSGYGVIHRKPEIKYKKQSDFKELQKTQFNILSSADNYLKSGGRILYSTCTLRKAENEDQVSAFLDKHPNYRLEYEHKFLPHIDGTDGFYCALMIKSR